MPDDPYDPDWRPEHDPHSSISDIGSGRGFGSDLYALYRAGRILFPEVAKRYEAVTAEVDALQGPMEAILRVPGHYEPAHSSLLSLRSDLQRVLRTSCLAIAETGTALVDTVTTYVVTDEEAAEEFNKRLENNRHEYLDPPASVDPP